MQELRHGLYVRDRAEYAARQGGALDLVDASTLAGMLEAAVFPAA